ncbi:hypothetical protein FJK98_02235 [Micromonospora sp. HM134]|uniref:hypothetical protein n=1 Tax=Micromonospora sp. HM134 TaxID=2583243 RepID=UPI00119876DE|nr:hypothetical protein [Micromonospora sp. HM134]QDY06123.1 hypothetical protein FJK98_02235 [Micromonospora sp. HM134]
MSRGRARSRARRDARYRRAIIRQHLLNTVFPGRYAPVEDFLRKGDTVDMFVDAQVDHSACDFGWKPVQCDRCGAKYVCTPSSDFYCAAEGDHCCEPCLLRGMRATSVVVVGTLTIGGDR